MAGNGEGGVGDGETGQDGDDDAEQSVHRGQRAAHVDDGMDGGERLAVLADEGEVGTDQTGRLPVESGGIQTVGELFGLARPHRQFDGRGVGVEVQSEHMPGEVHAPDRDGVRRLVGHFDDDEGHLLGIQAHRIPGVRAPDGPPVEGGGGADAARGGGRSRGEQQCRDGEYDRGQPGAQRPARPPHASATARAQRR
ncbi:hypothetical protein KHQ06_35580 [Nocardia tengchongensis]|uniref:Uncharacterized protein n=1 Tax=Nocardia tengchongensis TaxID=2055889 RepID=A0ABX8CMV3_9NOCA|nr:hypothetical protein [Nocardia tengchongensis]QVI21257.1 hypothetical protein KHQ06_35580 [Nocardia tengchongensis]